MSCRPLLRRVASHGVLPRERFRSFAHLRHTDLHRTMRQSGRHVLELSSSQFDPKKKTSGMIAAAEVLILSGENGGDPIFAVIA
jgi:hypothetical protein